MLWVILLRMRLTALFLATVVAAAAHGQTEFDSLWSVWLDRDQADTIRAHALSRYAWSKYLYSRPDSAEYYGQMLYDFADRKGLVKWKAWALRGQGVSYKIRGVNSKALDYWLRSESMSRSVNDLPGVAGSLNNIGILYFELGDLPHSLEYHERSLALRRMSGDSVGVGASLSSISEILRLKGDTDSALVYATEALRHNERIGYSMGRGIAHMRLGDVYSDIAEFRDALREYTLALGILRAGKSELMTAECLTHMGRAHLAVGDHAQAIKRCEQSLALADSTMNLGGQMLACECLHAAYRAVNQRDRALYFLERSKQIDDSMRTADLAMKMQRMEFTKQLYADSTVQAEREQRKALEAEAVLSRERTGRNILLSATIAVLVLAGGLWSRLRYINRSNTIIQAEKDRSDGLLLNILPADVARELKEEGVSQARHIDQATILFSDFKDFTELSGELSATNLVAEIDACFEAFDGITEKYGVEKIKTIGDAYMAAGGLPVPSEGSVKRTVLAALEMQAFIEARHAERIEAGLPAFRMRVGIHVGPVVAGIVGVKKFQYDIWGDTVNTANRMETSGEVGRVNVSGATYQFLKDDRHFRFTARGMVQVKGKGEMEMYFVETAASVSHFNSAS